MKNILQIIVLINLLVGQTKTETKIITNHIGYELNAPKKAIILASKYDRIKSFNLKVYPRNYTILTGKPVYSGPVDKWRNWVFWTVDLTVFDKEGQYILECEVN